jgi:DNA-directed RNA polymerase specialized sigma24 family protein
MKETGFRGNSEAAALVFDKGGSLRGVQAGGFTIHPRAKRQFSEDIQAFLHRLDHADDGIEGVKEARELVNGMGKLTGPKARFQGVPELDPEDIGQENWLRALSVLARWWRQHGLHAALKRFPKIRETLVRNGFLDEVRKLSRRRSCESHGCELDQLCTQENSPLEQVSASELASKFTSVLTEELLVRVPRLPEVLRRTLLLKMCGMTPLQIAGELGVPAKTIHRRLYGDRVANLLNGIARKHSIDDPLPLRRWFLDRDSAEILRPIAVAIDRSI